jgi:hypothetical protein
MEICIFFVDITRFKPDHTGNFENTAIYYMVLKYFLVFFSNYTMCWHLNAPRYCYKLCNNSFHFEDAMKLKYAKQIFEKIFNSCLSVFKHTSRRNYKEIDGKRSFSLVGDQCYFVIIILLC